MHIQCTHNLHYVDHQEYDLGLTLSCSLARVAQNARIPVVLILIMHLLQVCRTFLLNGTCSYGKRCRFIHCTSSAASHNPDYESNHSPVTPTFQINEPKGDTLIPLP